jgi:hypothetical protein
VNQEYRFSLSRMYIHSDSIQQTNKIDNGLARPLRSF